MTCSICNDYKTQIKNAITNGRYEQAEAIKALYVQHLAQAHAGEMVSKPDREPVHKPRKVTTKPGRKQQRARGIAVNNWPAKVKVK